VQQLVMCGTDVSLHVASMQHKPVSKVVINQSAKLLMRIWGPSRRQFLERRAKNGPAKRLTHTNMQWVVITTTVGPWLDMRPGALRQTQARSGNTVLTHVLKWKPVEQERREMLKMKMISKISSKCVILSLHV
jgi:hypothetical protein